MKLLQKKVNSHKVCILNDNIIRCKYCGSWFEIDDDSYDYEPYILEKKSACESCRDLCLKEISSIVEKRMELQNKYGSLYLKYKSYLKQFAESTYKCRYSELRTDDLKVMIFDTDGNRLEYRDPRYKYDEWGNIFSGAIDTHIWVPTEILHLSMKKCAMKFHCTLIYILMYEEPVTWDIWGMAYRINGVTGEYEPVDFDMINNKLPYNERMAYSNCNFGLPNEPPKL